MSLPRGFAAAALMLLTSVSPAAAGTFEVIAVHPDAALQPSTTGRSILTIRPWQGRLYAGFGDYDANTGPIAIRAFDPATLTFSGTSFRSGTEAVYLYREISGDLHAPHIDPLAGESSGGFALARAAAPDAWADRFPVTAVHLYDVFTFDGTDRWLVGSRGNDAAAWRSLDGLTWVNVPEITVPPTAPSTFTRFYFALVQDGKVHVQAASSSTSKVFDGASWSDGPDLLPGFGYGWHSERLGALSVYQGGHAGFGATSLLTFDGTSAVELPIRVYDFTVADGNLFALAGRFVPQPGSASGGYWTVDGVYQTADLCTWSVTAQDVPSEVRSIAVLDGTLWAGATTSSLLRWSDTVASLAIAPPPEVQDLRVSLSGDDVITTWTPASPLGNCVEHAVLATTAWPQAIFATWSELDRTTTASWTHVGSARDGVALRSYLIRASSPAGAGPLGAYGL